VLQWLAMAIEARAQAGPGDKQKRRPKVTLTRAEYNQWRRQQLRTASSDAPRPPSDALIRKCFGDWDQALGRAAELKAGDLDA
jgi:hypothetical protein